MTTYDRLVDDLLRISNDQRANLVAAQTDTLRHAAVVLAAVAADYDAVMTAVDKVIDPFGYDVNAACGPGDVIPGLEQAAAAITSYVAMHGLPDDALLTLDEWDEHRDRIAAAFAPAIALARIRAVNSHGD